MYFGTILGFFIALAVMLALMGRSNKARGDPVWEAGFLFYRTFHPFSLVAKSFAGVFVPDRIIPVIGVK